MATRRDRSGEVHNYLTIISLSGITKNRNSIWKCRCSCGTISDVVDSDLLNGNVKSCRACGYKRHNEAITKHGHAKGTFHGGRVTRIYTCWLSMKQRCHDPKATNYHKCGGAGVIICEGLNDFVHFHAVLGDMPSGMEIDRWPIQQGNYLCGSCPQCLKNNWVRNVRWATEEQQANNRSSNVNLTHNGKTQTLTQWSRELGISYHVIRKRRNAGRTVAEILTP